MGKYALLIGVGEYGEGLQPLPAAPKDVEALAEVLQNPDMGGFDEVKKLLNPSQGMMAREIELWFQGRKEDDLVLLFFSGHGVKDDRRDLYFAAKSTEKSRNRLVRSTATPARFVSDCIRGCNASQQVVILDCCFSGAFGDMVARDDGVLDLKEQLGAEGRVVLTSTNAVGYSFEEKEKEAELSIYTRYLVEGIASGAADEDEDGDISIEELHRYASRKVEKAAPAMSPDIITLKGEGYRILLARSPQDDPKLKYRKEAERRVREGKWSTPAKRILQLLRVELSISDTEAEVIESEITKPYQEYQRKLDEYLETLQVCLQEEATLSSTTLEDLIDYRRHLGLKPQDVELLEKELLGYRVENGAAQTKNQLEIHRAQVGIAAPEPKDEFTNLPSHYQALKDHLEQGRWREADEETFRVMLEVTGQEEQGYLNADDIQTFPYDDLRIIDLLWVKFSAGLFGFSVQKELYIEAGNPLDGKYHRETFGKFAEQIGWRKDGIYIRYSKLTWSKMAVRGHLPKWRVGGLGMRVLGSLLSRSDL